MDERIVETREILAREGQVLTVEMTQPFIDRLRQHFGLFGDQPLEDDQVKTYVLEVLASAVAKAEREVKQDAEPAQDVARVRRPRRRKKGAGS